MSKFNQHPSASASSGGITFTSLLTIVFIVLKLTNYINWSWWWVLSPIWLPLCIIFLLYFFILLVNSR